MEKVRKISYGRKFRKQVSANFSWVNGKGAEWRKRLKDWADYRGFKNTDEIKAIYGKNWSYWIAQEVKHDEVKYCLLYTSPSPRDMRRSRMPSSA